MNGLFQIPCIELNLTQVAIPSMQKKSKFFYENVVNSKKQAVTMKRAEEYLNISLSETEIEGVFNRKVKNILPIQI